MQESMPWEVQRMERDSAHYIAWRSGFERISMEGLGGIPVNTDDRLWNDAGKPFVLSVFRGGNEENYAVDDADAEDFIERVLRQSGEDARLPSRPAAPSGEGTKGEEPDQAHIPWAAI